MDKAKRKAIIAGNWKMNKTASEAAVLVDELIPAVKDATCEVVICTPFTDLVTAVAKTKGTNIHVGAENVHFEKSGAFTCLLYTSQSPRDLSTSRMPSSA